MLDRIIVVIVCVFFLSCNTTTTKKLVKYSTTVDSTLFYYKKGWQEIMDNGDYGAAEISYRKSLEYDPHFLIGKSVLARLTLDLNERLALYQTIEEQKHTIQGDERLILDVYHALTRYTNLREQKSVEAKSALQDALNLAEYNFREIAYKYPDEIYLKSEYIEILHSQYGAKRSLDSLYKLATTAQQNKPFLLGYKAILTAEMSNFQEALKYAEQLKIQMKDLKVAKPDAILADIYFKMEDYKMAKIHADKAVTLDSRNLDASRLKEKIDTKLK